MSVVRHGDGGPPLSAVRPLRRKRHARLSISAADASVPSTPPPSTPPRALAVACHDLGHIATAVPRGRAVIAETGAKAALLRLMTHDEEDVRKQALLATQKLLVVGWQYLG